MPQPLTARPLYGSDTAVFSAGLYAEVLRWTECSGPSFCQPLLV